MSGPRWCCDQLRQAQSALSPTALCGLLGAFYVGNPNSTDTVSLGGGNSLQSLTDDYNRTLVLSAGDTAFTWANSSAHMGGKAVFKTTPSTAGQKLVNVNYSPVSALGATPTAWDTHPWSMVAVVSVQAVANLGGGTIIGGSTGKSIAMGIGGTAFGGAGEVMYLARVNPTAALGMSWGFQPAATLPTGPMITSMTWDGGQSGGAGRARNMVQGIADAADGAAMLNSDMTVGGVGFGVVEGLGESADGDTEYGFLAFFPYEVPIDVMVTIHNNLAAFFGIQV